MWRTWVSTVLGVTHSRSAMPRSVRPSATSASTSRSRAVSASPRTSAGQAQLLEHLEPVEHQVEARVPAAAEAQDLDVLQAHGAARGRHVARRGGEDAVVRAGERALLGGDVTGEVERVDVDARVGERAEPA